MKVRDIMTTEVVTAQPDVPLKRVAELLVQRGVSGLPVCDTDGNVVGVVSEADLLFKQGAERPEHGRILSWLLDEDASAEHVKRDARTAGNAMTSPAVTIGPERPVAEAARTMVERGINRLPVVEDDRLVGIVTRADLVRAFTRSDADIAHEIRDDVICRMLWIADEGVAVDVVGGEVTLRGTVGSSTDAELIERFSARVAGVVSVRSELHTDEVAPAGRVHRPRV
ncbi:MAG TPA: CBS domain-containing protein [Gaiella sp.]|jgi:CBS domain-containing protein